MNRYIGITNQHTVKMVPFCTQDPYFPIKYLLVTSSCFNPPTMVHTHLCPSLRFILFNSFRQIFFLSFSDEEQLLSLKGCFAAQFQLFSQCLELNTLQVLSKCLLSHTKNNQIVPESDLHSLLGRLNRQWDRTQLSSVCAANESSYDHFYQCCA